MKVTKLLTPNRSTLLLKPRGIVWHHTGGSFNGSVAWCMDRRSKVSYNGIVNLNGDYTQLAEDFHRTWANGASIFKGMKNCNSFMLSIAVSGDTNNRLLTEEEIESMARITIDKMRKHKFSLDWVTTHRFISPNRKNDVDVRAEKAIRERILDLL